MPSLHPTSASAPLTPIRTVIATVLHGLERPPHPTVDAETWKAVAGPALAAHSAPAALQDGQLTVHVERAAHLFLLHLKHRELLQRLQQRLGTETVRALRFRVGQIT